MRITLAILLACVVGVLIGVGRTMFYFGVLGGSPAVAAVDFPPDEADRWWNPPQDGPQPAAKPDHELFQFRRMEVGSTLRHSFPITNAGAFPLVVRKSDSSCACTVANVGGGAIAPGKSAEVILEWTTKAGSRPGDQFRQWAKVETNDPARPFITFTVEGELVGALAAEQPDLALGRVALSETRTARMRLYAFRRPEAKKLAAMRIDVDPHAPTDPISVATAPLAAGELALEGAVDGLWLDLTLKPGLPLGEIRRTIRLRTNLPGAPQVAIAVTGEIVPDVSLVGPGYSERTGVLSLGQTQRGRPVERKLHVVVFGPHRQTARPTVAGRRPDWLEVSIGAAEPGPDNQSMRYPITVRIPAHAPPVVLEGPTPDRLGEVTLATGVAEPARLRLLVKMRVNEP